MEKTNSNGFRKGARVKHLGNLTVGGKVVVRHGHIGTIQGRDPESQVLKVKFDGVARLVCPLPSSIILA